MQPPKVWSSYQQAIFADIKSGEGHLLVSARAGSGKTSTLLESLKYIDKKHSILVVAFNTRIAEELNERAPSYSNLEICTLHSFGYKMVRQALGKVKLDKDKDFGIIKKRLEAYKKSSKERDDYDTIFQLKKSVSLCKGLLADTPEAIDDIIDEYDISLGSLEREDFISETIQTLGDCKKNIKSISFDDMVWLPYVLHLPIDQYDRVQIDELQDLTPANKYLVLKACKKDGRIIGYGDQFQCVYSFRGANIDGMDEMQKKLSARVLPLPISYRCGKAIIKEAQYYVPDIEHAPNAKEGLIVNITEKEIVSFVKPNDFILSRTNAPLVKMCFTLWRNKIPATIKGKDLGPSLLGLITQSKKKTVPAFVDWLYKWANSEVLRLKGKNRKGNSIMDRVDCLVFLSEGKEKIADLVASIKSLFENKDESGVVILSSIHMSKGLEADRVFVLMKSFFAGDESQEEKNVAYVARTRAKEVLFYVR